MIYRFESESDPITRFRYSDHVEAADFDEAVEQAKLLMREHSIAIHSKPEHARLTLVEETDIRIAQEAD